MSQIAALERTDDMGRELRWEILGLKAIRMSMSALLILRDVEGPGLCLP